MLPPDGTIEAFALVLARTGALVGASPILGFGTGFSGYKIALVFGLSGLLYTSSAGPLPGAGDAGAIGYGALMLREVLIGLFLGFFLHLAFLAVRVAGEMIGHEMGFMVARQVDPATGIQTPLITSVYENLFILATLSMNGHHWLIRSLDASFTRAPIGSLSLGEGLGPTIQLMFAEMFEAGIVFAAPVMVFLVLVSILIGLLSRAVPNMNVLEVGFSIRVLVSLCAMFLFAPVLEPALTNAHESLIVWLERGLGSLEG